MHFTRSTDNYGNRDTPVFGGVIEAFQGHHVSPWTITHRSFYNNVHKVGERAKMMLVDNHCKAQIFLYSFILMVYIFRSLLLRIYLPCFCHATDFSGSFAAVDIFLRSVVVPMFPSFCRDISQWTGAQQ
jgi:hypothetical protein